MLATSSRCSFRNQSRNCAPTRSFSSRASEARRLIWAVTCFSCSSASFTGATGSGNVVFGSTTAGTYGLVRVEQVLDDHVGVVPLLDGLPVEVRGELGSVSWS